MFLITKLVIFSMILQQFFHEGHSGETARRRSKSSRTNNVESHSTDAEADEELARKIDQWHIQSSNDECGTSTSDSKRVRKEKKEKDHSEGPHKSRSSLPTSERERDRKSTSRGELKKDKDDECGTSTSYSRKVGKSKNEKDRTEGPPKSRGSLPADSERHMGKKSTSRSESKKDKDKPDTSTASKKDGRDKNKKLDSEIPQSSKIKTKSSLPDSDGEKDKKSSSRGALKKKEDGASQTGSVGSTTGMRIEPTLGFSNIALIIPTSRSSTTRSATEPNSETATPALRAFLSQPPAQGRSLSQNIFGSGSQTTAGPLGTESNAENLLHSIFRQIRDDLQKSDSGVPLRTGLFGSTGSSTQPVAFGSSQPAFGQSQPCFGSSQSAFGSSHPTFESSQPAIGQSPLAFRNSQPAFGQPAFGSSQSTFGSLQSAFGSSQSAFGQSQPAFGSSQSTFGSLQSAFGSSQSAFGQSQPALGSSQSIFSSSQPALGSSQPAFGSSQQLFGCSQPALWESLTNQPALGSSSSQNKFGSYHGFTPPSSKSGSNTPFSSFGSNIPFGHKTPQAFGQAPQAFGQAPQAFGQAPQAFGQAPQAFGQAPQAFGQAPSWVPLITASMKKDESDNKKKSKPASPFESQSSTGAPKSKNSTLGTGTKMDSASNWFGQNASASSFGQNPAPSPFCPNPVSTPSGPKPDPSKLFGSNPVASSSGPKPAPSSFFGLINPVTSSSGPKPAPSFFFGPHPVASSSGQTQNPAPPLYGPFGQTPTASTNLSISHFNQTRPSFSFGNSTLHRNVDDWWRQKPIVENIINESGETPSGDNGDFSSDDDDALVLQNNNPDEIVACEHPFESYEIDETKLHECPKLCLKHRGFFLPNGKLICFDFRVKASSVGVGPLCECGHEQYNGKMTMIQKSCNPRRFMKGIPNNVCQNVCQKQQLLLYRKPSQKNAEIINCGTYLNDKSKPKIKPKLLHGLLYKIPLPNAPFGSPWKCTCGLIKSGLDMSKVQLTEIEPQEE